MTSSSADARPRPLSPGWWLRDREGRILLAQWPNAALLVWLATFVTRLSGVLDADQESRAADIGRGALLVWSIDELVRGASPARRLLGGVVLVAQILALFG